MAIVVPISLVGPNTAVFGIIIIYKQLIVESSIDINSAYDRQRKDYRTCLYLAYLETLSR